jgi:hypothetical protein
VMPWWRWISLRVSILIFKVDKVRKQMCSSDVFMLMVDATTR